MADEPVLKHRPSDFIVREVLVAKATDDDSCPYQYLLLAKTGFTTMEAVRIVAREFGLASTEVSYGGLKDEDGTTEQLLAMPRGHFTSGSWQHSAGADRTMRLTAYGYGNEPLSIGGLEGNAFRLVVRNLPYELALRLQELRKLNHLFINYYDIQRFGVPGGPRRTHLLGRAILQADWELALRELIGLAAPESQSGLDWTGTAEEFFRALDPRTTSFYLAAAASWDWNCQLREIVGRASSGAELQEAQVEGLTYHYLGAGQQVQQVLADQADLAYRRYSFNDGVISFRESSRPTVIQTQIALGERLDDEYHPGRSAIEFRFFLPSGCYATAAIRQLLARTDLAAAGTPVSAVG